MSETPNLRDALIQAGMDLLAAVVAPVTIGEGAMTGSGSVITANVAAGDLALGRAAQTVKTGWAARFRALKLARSAKR